MQIKNKSQPDPVAQLHAVNAYMRWACQAAEEVVGQQGMRIVLRGAGLAALIDNYPPNDLNISQKFTFGDYASLCTELLTFFGRAGKSMTIRIGRISAQHAVDQQAAVFGLNTLVKASRVLPLKAQLKAGLTVMQSGLVKLSKAANEERIMRIEDRGDKFAYIDETCPFCAGKQADSHICWASNGTIAQAIKWLTGRDFEVIEVECRAMGDRACVWEMKKEPIK